MASKYGTNYKKEYVTVPASRGGNGETNGVAGFFFDAIVIDSTDYPADTEVIPLLKLRAGQRIVMARRVHNLTAGDGNGSLGLTDSAGNLDDADGLIAATAHTSNKFVEGEGVLIGVKLTHDTVVNYTLTQTVASAVSGEEIKFIFLIADN